MMRRDDTRFATAIVDDDEVRIPLVMTAFRCEGKARERNLHRKKSATGFSNKKTKEILRAVAMATVLVDGLNKPVVGGTMARNMAKNKASKSGSQTQPATPGFVQSNR